MLADAPVPACCICLNQGLRRVCPSCPSQAHEGGIGNDGRTKSARARSDPETPEKRMRAPAMAICGSAWRNQGSGGTSRGYLVVRHGALNSICVRARRFRALNIRVLGRHAQAQAPCWPVWTFSCVLSPPHYSANPVQQAIAHFDLCTIWVEQKSARVLGTKPSVLSTGW